MYRFILIVLALIYCLNIPLSAQAQSVSPSKPTPEMVKLVIDSLQKLKDKKIINKILKPIRFSNNKKIRNEQREQSIVSSIEKKIIPQIDTLKLLSLKADSTRASLLRKADSASNAKFLLRYDTIKFSYDQMLTRLSKIDTDINKKILVSSKVVRKLDTPQAEIVPQNMTDLGNKLWPVLKDKELVKKEELQRKTALDNIYRIFTHDSSLKTSSFDSSNGDTLRGNYYLTIRKNLQVIGAGIYAPGDRLPDHYFSILSSAVMLPYTLNGRDGTIHNSAPGFSAFLDTAISSNCRIYMSVNCSSVVDIADFLNNTNHQANLIDTIYETVKRFGLTGVVLNFDCFPARRFYYEQDYAAKLDMFIRHLSEVIRVVPIYGYDGSKVDLCLVVPYTSVNNIFNLGALNSYIDKFIVNCAVSDHKPIAYSANGNLNNLDWKISTFRTENSSIPAQKIIAGMAFTGAKWTYQQDQFYLDSILTLGDILSRYKVIGYDDKSLSAYVDLYDTASHITGKIWFDNDQSLAAKLDYVNSEGLAGVAILPADDNKYYNDFFYFHKYDDLWKTLTVKTCTIDTLRKPEPQPLLTRMLIQTKLYASLLLHPRDINSQYEGPYYLGLFALCLLAAVLLLLSLYLYKIITVGSTWRLRRIISITILVLFIFDVLLSFAYIFLDPQMLIGVREDNKRTSYLVYLVVLGAGALAAVLVVWIRSLMLSRKYKP